MCTWAILLLLRFEKQHLSLVRNSLHNNMNKPLCQKYSLIGDILFHLMWFVLLKTTLVKGRWIKLCIDVSLYLMLVTCIFFCHMGLDDFSFYQLYSLRNGMNTMWWLCCNSLNVFLHKQSPAEILQIVHHLIHWPMFPDHGVAEIM